jgi:hypothetical protein
VVKRREGIDFMNIEVTDAATRFKECVADVQASLNNVAGAPLDRWNGYDEAISDLIEILEILSGYARRPTAK